MTNGNIGGGLLSGLGTGATGFVTGTEFPDELDLDQMHLHLMNNSEIIEAGQAFAGVGAEVDGFRARLAEGYGSADLTQDEAREMGLPDQGRRGEQSFADANTLILQRDAAMVRFDAAKVTFEQRTEEELTIVRDTFKSLADVLNGNSSDSIEIRQQIEDVNAAEEALRSKYNELDAAISDLEARLAQTEGTSAYTELREMARAYDEWIMFHENPQILVVAPTELGGQVYNANGISQGNDAVLIRRVRHEIDSLRRQVSDVHQYYPEEYKKYTALMSGRHLRTWAEFWWILFTQAAWFIAAEVAAQVAALALAPFTAGASIVLINAARHVQRTRYLGGIVRSLQNSGSVRAAARMAGGALAVARWLHELVDAAIDWILWKFDDLARKVLGRPRRDIPEPEDAGLEVDGPPPGSSSLVCPLCR